MSVYTGVYSMMKQNETNKRLYNQKQSYIQGRCCPGDPDPILINLNPADSINGITRIETLCFKIQ